MKTLLLRSCAVLGLLALGACAQTAPSAPLGPPVVNATPPPLPPDPALGPHATPAQEPAQRGRRR
jgi:hypothetical protein